MNAHHFKFAGVAVVCLSAASACGSNGGESPSGKCPTSIAGSQGANNMRSSLNGATFTGEYGGPDGSGFFVAICMTDGPQALSIALLGAKPAVGVTYGVATPSGGGNNAGLQYGEGQSGTKVWSGTAGSVKIDSVAPGSVALTFTSVTMAPDPSANGNMATGRLMISGSGKADDVVGFVP